MKSTTTSKKESATTGVQLRSKSNKSAWVFEKSDWIVIPIGIMVIVCLSLVVMKAYALTHILTPSFYDAFWFPPLPSLFVAIYGIMYIYKTLHREFIGSLAKAIIYVLFIVFVVFVFVVATIVGGKGHLCTGILGVLTDCSEVNAATLHVLFASPLSLTLVSGLAITGSAALLLKPRSDT